ncbi:DUF5957 family protein [Nonomuraea antimicrobica]
MRTLGVAILGLFAGLAVGFLLFNDLVARLFVSDGTVRPPWTFVLGFGPMILAVIGAAVAVAIDNRRRGRS